MSRRRVPWIMVVATAINLVSIPTNFWFAWRHRASIAEIREAQADMAEASDRLEDARKRLATTCRRNIEPRSILVLP